MSEFEVKQCWSYKVVDEQGSFLHSDGTTVPRGEYWSTHEQAQAVLDKFRPEHEWVHGDVFRTRQNDVMMYHKFSPNCARKPQAVRVVGADIYGPSTNLASNLKGATFLFNIKDILSDRGLA